jgi:hypothetical protein
VVWAPADSLDARWLEAFLDSLDRGLAHLEELVGGPHPWQRIGGRPVQFYLSPGRFVSHASGRDAVFISLSLVRARRAPFLHEAAHELLAGPFPFYPYEHPDSAAEEAAAARFPLWLGEGLPDVLAQTAAAATGFPEGDVFQIGGLARVDSACAARLAASARQAEILEKVGGNGWLEALFTSERAQVAPIYYACSQSFTKYLADRIGIRALVSIFARIPSGRWTADLEAAAGEPLPALRQRWLAAVRHQSGARAGSPYLFVWAGDADRQQSDFLAVIDVDPQSAGYATVVATAPVGAAGTVPHHTEYEMGADGVLWANGFAASRTYRFDLRDPTHPRLLGSLGDPGSFTHPHSYARLPNGNVLATFQQTAGARPRTGGLVEFDSTGRVVRSVDAAVPAIDAGVRPYSLAVLPALDRVVTTATDMHLETRSRAVQVWRLSDLTLRQTLFLPPGPRGDESAMTAEPRVLADGRTVLVNTFTCGLYRLHGLEGDSAWAEWVHSSPAPEERRFCAVPVVAGRFWIQTSGPEHAVVTLDVSDPSHPREVGRLTLEPDETPHWIALEPNGDRLVITGYQGLESRVLLARLDRHSGALHLDSTFTSPGAERLGVDLGRARLPHGPTGPAIPHGAVFSRP